MKDPMNWLYKYQLYLFLLLIHNASTSETNGSNVISHKHFAVEIPKPIIPFDLPESDTVYIQSRTLKSRTWNAQKSKRPSMVDIALDIAAREGIDAMTDLYQNIEPRIAKNGQLLEDNHPAALLSKFSAPLEGSEHSAMAAFATLSATKAFRRNNKESDVLGRQAQAQKVSFRRTPLEGLCPPRDPPTCMPASQRYRTHDGTCNNRRRLRWGSAQMPFNRFLPPEYGDRVDSIRESIEGGPLSSSRFVSLLVHGAREGEAPLTLMTVQWGQLLDHDLTSTAQPRSINGSVPSCCGPNDFHPSCFPIKVPLDDPWLAPLKVRCLEFLRSAAAQRRDCVLSWREQTNQVTSYIDASPIYSSNAKTSDNARIFRNGLLVYGRGDPKEDVCMRGALAHQCIRSGDGRSGEQPGLLALHHVWVGEHNRIAMELSMLNPHWSDEKVYQETRRIIGALFQHITYREFLPIVLGREVCKLFDLELVKTSYFTGYDQNTNPTVSNAFAAAAFRFGHSLVQNTYMRCDRHHNFINNNVTLHEEFQQGDIGTAGSLHRLLRGLATQRALKRDEFITPELTNHLFQTPGFPFGLDLAAINIQRGRDHGIAPYTAWRQPCGLSAINTWDELSNVVGPGSAKRISHAYRNVHDIDLFVGGIAERPVVGGLVGPTFACIIAQQFSNSRKGDRFWYENSGFESSFTPAQLNSIRHVSLASVLCRALNGGTLQPHVFIPSDVPGNQRVKCGKESLEPIDLSPWLEQDPFLSEKIDVPVNKDPSLPSPMEIQTNKEEKGINNRLQNLTMVSNVDFIPNSSIGFHRVPNMTKVHDKLDMAQKVVARPFIKPIRGISNKLDKNRLTIKNSPKSTVSPLTKRTTPRRTVVIHNVEIELRSASGVKEQTDYSKQTSVKHESIASTAQNTIMKVAGVVRSQMNAALGFLKGNDDASGGHSSRQLNDKQLTSNVDTTVKQINTNSTAEILMMTERQTGQQNTDQQPSGTNGFSESTEFTEQHEVMTDSTNQTSNNLDRQHLVRNQTPNLNTKQLNNDKVNLFGLPELIIRLDNKTDTNTVTSSSTENFKSNKTFDDGDRNKINEPTKTILRNLTDSPPDKNSKSFRSKGVFANRRKRAQTAFREDYPTNNSLRIQIKTNLTTSNRNYSTSTKEITKSADISTDSYDTYKDFQAIIDSALQDPLGQHKRVHLKTDFQMPKMEIRTYLDFSDKLRTLTTTEKSNKPTKRQLNDKQLTSNVDTTVKQINTNTTAEILMTTEQQNTDNEITELTEQHEAMTEPTHQTSNNLDGQHLVSNQTPNLNTKQLNNDKVNLFGLPELIIRLDNKTDTNTLTSSSTENFKSNKTFDDSDIYKINGPTKTFLRNLTDSPPDKNNKSFRSKEVFANRRQRAQTAFREDDLTNNNLRIQNKTNLDTTTTQTTSNRNYSTSTKEITESADTSSDSYDTYKDFQAIIDSALQDPLDQHKRVHRKTDFQMSKMEIQTNIDFSDKLRTLTTTEKSNKPTRRQLKKTTFQIAAKIIPDQELDYKNYSQLESNLTFHNANLTFHSTTELPATLRNVELRQFQERPIYNRPSQKLILDGPESDQYEIEINIRQTNTKPPNYYANNPEYSPNKRYDSDRYVSSHHYDHQQSQSTSPSDNYFTQTTRIPYATRTKPPTIIYIDEHDERTTTRAPGFFQNIISFASNGINSIRQQATSTNGPFNSNRITNSDNYPSSQPPRPYQHAKPSSGNYQLPQPQPYPPPHVFPQQGFPQQGFPQQGPLGFNPNVGPPQIGPPGPFYPPQPLPGANSFSTASNFGGTAHATSSALSTGHFGAIAGSAASSGGDSTFSFNIRPSSRPQLNLVQSAGNKPDYELLPQRRPQFSSTPSYANPPRPISSAESLHYPPNKHDPFSSHTRRPPTHYAKHPNNVLDLAYDDIGRSDLSDDESVEINTNTSKTTDDNTSNFDIDDYDYNDDDDDDEAFGNAFKTYSFVESGEDDKIDYLKLAEQAMTNITKPNATTQFDDNFVMPVLRSSDEKLEERTIIKDSNETNPSVFPTIEQKSFNHDILAEDYDELALGRSSFLESQIAAASGWDKIKGPVDNVPVAFAPIKVLTKPERPDNWVIYDAPDDKKPVLPDQPDYDTETLTAAEVPMPLKKPKISHSSKLRTSLSVQKDDKDRSTTTDKTLNTKLDETTVTVEERTEQSQTNVATDRTTLTTNNLTEELDDVTNELEEMTTDVDTMTEQTVTETTQTENDSMNTEPTNKHYDQERPLDENIPNLT